MPQYKANFRQIRSDEEIFKQLQQERNNIGYYNLPNQDTTVIKNYARNVNKQHIVVVGIGGSSLGARAIYDFLLPSNEFSKNLFFRNCGSLGDQALA